MMNEVWVKVGGDKGGGTFKMSLQLANVAHPNSINNTFVFACFEANDSVTNLHDSLDGYRDQVPSRGPHGIDMAVSTTMKVITNKVQLIFQGQCFFVWGLRVPVQNIRTFRGSWSVKHKCSLSVQFDLTCRHCCLWCHVTSTEMQLSPSSPTKRNQSSPPLVH